MKLKTGKQIPKTKTGKTILQGRSPNFTADLLSLNNKTVRLITSLQIEYMCSIKLAEEATCRFCSEAYAVLLRKSKTRLDFYKYANSYAEEPMLKLCGLIKRTKLNKTFLTQKKDHNRSNSITVKDIITAVKS